MLSIFSIDLQCQGSHQSFIKFSFMLFTVFPILLSKNEIILSFYYPQFMKEISLAFLVNAK